MKLLFVSFALLWLGQLRAEQLFLYLTADCGTFIRYEHRVDGSARADYYSFNVTVTGGATAYLESDAAGNSLLTELPEHTVCTAGSLDASVVERINRGETQLTLITDAADGGYTQHPVLMATLITVRDGRTVYTSPFASFAYNLQETVIGENLDVANEGGTVYFSGRAGNDCTSPYLFYEQDRTAAYSRIDYQLYPGVGILERQLTAATENSQNDLIVAREINGLPVDDYLRDHCASVSAEPVYTEQQLTFRPTYAPESEPESTLPESYAPASTASNASVHTVARGETLYGISRQYTVTVDRLRELNGLTNNTITEGQVLRVDTDSELPMQAIVQVPEAELPTTIEVVPTPEYPAVTVPGTDNADYVDVPRPRQTTSSMHTVLAGETLASIARRYGYTKERFLAFNDISDQSVALVGQQLRTSDCSCPDQAADVPAQYVSVPPPAPVAPESVPEPEPSPVVPPAYGNELAQHDFTHVVREGETLYAIARQYGISVQELRQRNNLPASDVIVPFQKLRVN